MNARIGTTTTRRALLVAGVLGAGLLLAGSVLAAEGDAEGAAKDERKPWGTLVSEDGKQTIALRDDKVVIGSAADAGARIEHQTVAPQHARLVYEDGAVYLEHLGSRLGTLLAGRELKKGKKERLVRDTLLTFGAVSWRFSFGERDTIPATMKAKSRPKQPAKARSGSKAERKSGRSKE
ncbi:MAG: FHA domain-containing protein [Deltaproteobacteria bacterium]|nr:FHA domain-containing protein [Deltaproteobacteria bacterium]